MTEQNTHTERTVKHITFGGKQLTVNELGIKLPFAYKPINLAEVTTEGKPCRVLVTETKCLTPTEFDQFAHRLLTSVAWLDGKGGYIEDARLCVEVCAPGRPVLYVDPSGHDYGRYVGRIA